jgi:hypothetical protein
MSIRFSTGLRNRLTNGQGLASIFNRGYIEIYSGAQPATADAAKTGTLLGTVTASSGALTKETRAAGTVTITAAAGGSIDAITVGGVNIIPDGIVSATAGDTAATATSLGLAINRFGMYEATVSGSVVTIRPRPGAGAVTGTIAGTLTTVTATYVALGTTTTGIAPVNGLIFGAPAAGVIAKLASQIWSFNGVAAGTAGWFRLYASDTADTGALLSAEPYYPRLDGSIAVSGADMNLSNITIAIGAPNTIDSFIYTQPAA